MDEPYHEGECDCFLCRDGLPQEEIDEIRNAKSTGEVWTGEEYIAYLKQHWPSES